MLQVAFPAIVPPVKVTEPAVLVTIPPPHWGEAGTPETVTPTGKVSVMETCVSGVFTSLFLMVIVSTRVSPTHMVFEGVKALLTEGGVTATTVKVALAGVVLVTATGVPPSFPVDTRLFVGMVLIKLPVVVEVTFTSTKHSPGVAPTWAGTVPPLNDKAVVLGTATTAPPHVLLIPAGFAMDNPGWMPTRLSDQLALVS